MPCDILLEFFFTVIESLYLLTNIPQSFINYPKPLVVPSSMPQFCGANVYRFHTEISSESSYVSDPSLFHLKSVLQVYLNDRMFFFFIVKGHSMVCV